MSDPTQRERITRLDLLGQFLIVFLPFLFVLAAATVAHYVTISHAARVERETSEILAVGLARRAVASDLSGVVTDLMFLADYVRRKGVSGDGRVDQEAVGELFQSFAGQKRLYDQIRLLDQGGRELVRVNYRGGAPVPEAPSRLQDKAERYYFREAMQLAPGAVYISPLDLNKEFGQIEQPPKPMMRFAVAVAGDDWRVLLVLNYLGDRMLSHFRRAGGNALESLHLVDEEGYWLSGPSPDLDWGFMLPHGRSFAAAHREAWGRIATAVAGQFRSGGVLYTFETVTPHSVAAQTNARVGDTGAGEAGDYRMKVITSVREPMGLGAVVDFFRQHLPLYSMIFVVLVIGSYLLAGARTRHRQAELQGAYERRFRHTLEDIQLAAVLIDKSGRVEFCNDYFLRLCGLTRDEVLGERWTTKFVANEQVSAIEAAFQELRAAGGFPRDLEARLVTRDGEDRLMAWHNTLMRDADGEIAGITCLGEDISERRQAEEQVRKLSRAVEQSPSIVMLTNRHGEIEYVNPKFVEVTGYSREQVLGKNPRFLKSGEMPPGEYERLWERVQAGGEWRGEFHNRRRNGELYWESASISGLRGPDGEITHFVAVKEDITARKELEAEVEARKRELARSESLAAMGRMATMVAHDLRNPLSSVKMGVQIMGRQGGEQARELSSIAIEQIRHMETILTDMLAYARPEAVRTKWISIEKILDLSIRSVQRHIDEAGARLITDYQPGLPTVPADPDKLRQVFSNLVVNAVQAAAGNAEGDRELSVSATVSLGEEGTGVRIEVCDNGDGIDEADAEKLFEPFFTTRAKGTGLGLPICRQIVGQHGGTVCLEPRATGGACAVVILPTTPSGKGASPAAPGGRRTGTAIG